MQEAKAAGLHGCKTGKHSHGKPSNPPFMRLSKGLQRRLGVTNVTLIISKNLTSSDCNFNEHRLLLSGNSLSNSPLMSMLTQEEREAVFREGKKDGESLMVLDQHGRSYQMNFKFLKSDQQYRLIGEWPKFVKNNGMCKGDLIELGAIRSDGHLVLTLMHNGMEQQTSEEIGAVKGHEEWVPKKTEAVGGATEDQISAYTGEVKCVEKWTLDDIEAAEGLLALRNLKDGTKL